MAATKEEKKSDAPKKKERVVDGHKMLMNRLCRIEGQIRGLKKMLENDTYCLDILIQVSAVNAALNSFGKELLTDHIYTRVVTDIRNGKEGSINELLEVIQKMIK